jgi:hypothetical protein
MYLCKSTVLRRIRRGFIMGKQLTMKEVKKEVSLYDQFITLPVTVNEDVFKVKVYPCFSAEKVKKLVDDIYNFHVQAKKENLEIKEDQFDDIISYFIVRHFTDIKMSKGKKAKTLYEEFKLSINSEIFRWVLESVTEDSINKVYDRINSINEFTLILQKQMNILNKNASEFGEKYGLDKFKNNVQ